MFVPVAGAKLFWANGKHLVDGFQSPGSIGSANNDGTGVKENLVNDVDAPCAVAADDQHVYWATSKGKIGRADLDGSNVDRNFISGLQEFKYVCGQIEVHSGYIYWTSQDFDKAGIGRAKLDGSDVTQRWIELQNPPLGLAVDREHLYWTWRGTESSDPIARYIGRANLDGTDPKDFFIHIADSGSYFPPQFLALDGAHIYAASLGSGQVVRANLDGTDVNADFMQIYGCGLAVNASHIFWGAWGHGGVVGRATLGGTEIDQSFISSANARGLDTCGVAVGP